jgi:Cof subfamily protein (haloacid dehalogenase superfamily)
MNRLLALDVDGTLLNSHHELTPATAQAVMDMQAQGWQIVLATGRQFSAIQPFVDQLSLTAPQITSHGAQITDPQTHEILMLQGIPEAAGRRALQIGAEMGVTMIIAGHGKTYTRQYNRDIEYLLTYGDPEPELLEDLAQALQPPPTHLIALAYQQDDLYAAAYEHFSRELDGQLNVYRTSPYYVEFLHPQASKGHALRSVCQHLHVPQQQVIAVGDSFNDVSMFAQAGLGVAMGNSHPDVQRQADRVIGGHDADGLAEFLRELLGS